jgi:hypothetical protein
MAFGGVLVIFDRGFYGFRLREQAVATFANQLWRVKTNLRPRFLKTLPDGSWLVQIIPTAGAERRTTTRWAVRVIGESIENGREIPSRIGCLP